MTTCGCKQSKYKKVTHVIFDMDGTILDTEAIYTDAITKISQEHGKTYTIEVQQKITGTKEEDAARVVIEDLSLPITIEEFLDKFHEYSNNMLPSSPFMPGAERMIRHLNEHDIPIAIATSSNDDSVNLKIKDRMDIFGMFHHIVAGGSDPEVKRGKPNPDIFLVCASRFDANPKPAECLVFEDSINGVKAGLSAGMQVVMIPEETVSYEQWKIATLRLDSFEQMPPELFGLPPFPTEK